MVSFSQDDDTIMRAPSTRGYLLIVAAACLWGTLGLIFRILHDDYRLTALAIAFLRAAIAFTILVVFLAITRPKLLKVTPRALPFFALYGFCGVTAFYFSYTQAVIQTTVTTAVVLLYTAPAFVTLIAWRVWGESLGARKTVALVLAFAGCALVARAYNPAQISLNLIGLAMGLAAGFTYALYTVFSKSALERFSSSTALTYALFFGALFLIPLQTLDGFAPLVQNPGSWLFLLLLAIGPTLGSLALYNAGLLRVPASNASLVATIEPVVASVLAFLFLGERLELLQMAGGAMVIGGAIWLSLDSSRVA
jgi:DME family drug/metabolite transporter